ncbi:MAG: glycoside hydrolase family 16 protein [Polaribacter sp.]|nr:glycoside hydrolase family 16 protein [Polaribacter sp.]
MRKNLFKAVLFCLMMISCSKSDPLVLGEESVIPSNLLITIEIVGADINNPNGNGSGKINISASATNAIAYKIKLGDGNEVENSTGTRSHTYIENGLASYVIEVFAISSTKNSIGGFKKINVFVDKGGLALVWSDEFNIDGAPDTSKWSYDIGRGSNGWGNAEHQYYTNRSENVKVENGVLKITAKKENYQGAQYTSSRLKSEGKFEFKYGRVEVRAKLPEGGGTWPAIWMLGANISSVGWPNCGEIDIMEHVGNNQNTIHGTLHYPGNSGGNGNGNTISVTNVSTTFHVYEIEWTSTEIKFFVDGTLFHSFTNTANVPFNHNFFFILNVAMGGNFGGDIDANFTQSTMEVDYIKVYQ